MSDSEEQQETKQIHVSPIAKPLANPKLTSKLLKLIKKSATKERRELKRGVRIISKILRKAKQAKTTNPNRLLVIAGDVSPIDIITHIPVLCEENNVPYVYVPSKDDLATGSETKGSTCCVLLDLNNDSPQLKLLKQCQEKVQKMSS
eukprot:TRINITY_DN15203_c0_g1_i1.p1 TRINITY_DN15203_c0_g1~~TRINITY_DN15203_c0_g1_i1.p1  ORF type:complete len:164 (+),score=44.88 TRINITY_DN15203_c0_g1_i1:53-493(+)